MHGSVPPASRPPCRDDPECVDLEELYHPKVRAALAEALGGRPVELDDEFDL